MAKTLRQAVDRPMSMTAYYNANIKSWGVLSDMKKILTEELCRAYSLRHTSPYWVCRTLELCKELRCLRLYI